MLWAQIFFYTWVVVFSLDGLGVIILFICCCGCCEGSTTQEQEYNEPVIEPKGELQNNLV